MFPKEFTSNWSGKKVNNTHLSLLLDRGSNQGCSGTWTLNVWVGEPLGGHLNWSWKDKKAFDGWKGGERGGLYHGCWHKADIYVQVSWGTWLRSVRLITQGLSQFFSFFFSRVTYSFNSPCVPLTTIFWYNLSLASSPFPPPVLSSQSVPLLYVVDRLPLGTRNKGQCILGRETTMCQGAEMRCGMYVGKGEWVNTDGRVVCVEGFIHLFHTFFIECTPGTALGIGDLGVKSKNSACFDSGAYMLIREK